MEDTKENIEVVLDTMIKVADSMEKTQRRLDSDGKKKWYHKPETIISIVMFFIFMIGYLTAPYKSFEKQVRSNTTNIQFLQYVVRENHPASHKLIPDPFKTRTYISHEGILPFKNEY